MSKVNLFPYNLGQASLNAKCNNKEIIRDSNDFELFHTPNIERFTIDFYCSFHDIENSIETPTNNKDLFKFCEPVIFLISKKSLKRKSIKMVKIDDFGIENKFSCSISFDVNEWFGDIVISCYVLLNTDLPQKFGYAFTKGSKLCLSKDFNIIFEKPLVNKKNKGKGIDIIPISFSDPKYSWLNNHFSDNIFAIDPSKKTEMPVLYINKDMNKDIMSLIKNDQKGEGAKATSRDLFFQIICNSVLNNLLSYSLTRLKDEYDSSNDPSDTSIENPAWDELDKWQRNLLENYSSYICPGSVNEDAKENILEMISIEKNFSNLLRRLPNIVQNSLETVNVFEQTVRSLKKR